MDPVGFFNYNLSTTQMKHAAMCLVLAAALSAAGCYHTTVVTGRPASATVVDKPWHPFLVHGLVPIGGDVDVSQECPDGVARVETEMTFLNGLVGGLTAGIFTPVHVKVTCASRAMGAVVIEKD